PDHVILGYQAEGARAPEQLEAWRVRQQISLELAAAFLRRHRERGCRFTPLGVAQGWSARSYGQAVKQLQRMGVSLLAPGGLARLKTAEVLEALAGAASARHPETAFHLFGVTRCEQVGAFADFGVASFDSTSPFRQAFKDAHDNYYWYGRNFPALR